jgi:hypothetical protein
MLRPYTRVKTEHRGHISIGYIKGKRPTRTLREFGKQKGFGFLDATLPLRATEDVLVVYSFG